MITDQGSGTRIDEIEAGIYRICVPVSTIPGGFTFNHYLIVDDEPLLFHAGKRSMFALVRGAIAAILPVERLRHISFSHYEADECGAINDFLAVSPAAAPLCGSLAARGSTTSPTGRRVRWRTVRPSRSGAAPSAGSPPRTSRMAGKPACCWRRRRGRSSAAISSRRAGPITRR